MRKPNRRGNRALEEHLPRHKWEPLANSYMALVKKGDPALEIADKLSRAYYPSHRVSPTTLVQHLEEIYQARRGGSAFQNWWALRDAKPALPPPPEPPPPAESAPTSDDPDKARALARIAASRDALTIRVRELAKQLDEAEVRHAKEKAAVIDQAAHDDVRRLTKERNEALRGKSEAQHLLQGAIDRATAAEAELQTLRRRPAADAAKLDEASETIRSLRGSLTSHEAKLQTAVRERDEKDAALQAALARVRLLEGELAASSKRATVVPIEAAKPLARQSDLDILNAAVEAGLMSDGEAFRRLRPR